MSTDSVSALIQIVKAWESLPEGHYSQQAIQSWISQSLAPAIKTCRKAIPEDIRSRTTKEALQRE